MQVSVLIVNNWRVYLQLPHISYLMQLVATLLGPPDYFPRRLIGVG